MISGRQFRLETDTRQGKLTAGAIFVVSVVLAWIIANSLIPGGVSQGTIIQGMVIGALNAMVAMGLIIIYRSIRVINFAQAALGSVASILTLLLVTASGWSYWEAVPVGIVSAIVAGYLTDLLIQWRFARAPRLIVTVATIGIAQLLGFIALELPHFFNHTLRPLTTFTFPIHATFTVSSVNITQNYILALVVVPVVLLGLYWFFVRTDTGKAIRGAADSNERALLLGIPVRKLTRTAWMIAGGMSGLAAILTEHISGTNFGQFQIALSMLIPLAAFVLAGMESLPLAFIWSLVIGVIQQAAQASYSTSNVSQIALLVLIVVGLFFQRSKQVRVTDTGLGEYVAVREVAPLPKALGKLKEVRISRVVILLLVAALAIAVPWIGGASATNNGVTAVVYAILAVSMVILVGWAGQISLGQFAFAGLGACVSGSLMVHHHMPFLVAMLVGGLVGGVLSVIIGLPALRLPGMTLAVVTLAFAVVMSTYVLSSQNFPALDPPINSVPPPHLIGRFSTSPPFTSLYEFGLLILAMVVVAAVSLRRSRTARAIKAVRDNGRAASAYGISALKTKLFAFGASGFVAGLSGAILIVHSSGISSTGFPATASLSVFIMVVVGGLGSITGAIAGAVYITFFASKSEAWQLIGSGAGVLLVLVIFPEGLGGLAFKVRDFVVRALAKAKGLSPIGERIGAAPTGTVAQGSPTDALTGAGAPGGRTHVAHSAALRLGALEDLELHGAGISSGSGGSVNAQPPGEETPVVSIVDASVAYGNALVLHDVALGVSASEIVALLGTNGAGKTTVLRAISGLVRPKKGRVFFLDEDVTSLSVIDRVKGGLVTVLGGRGIFPSLSVGENLRLATWTAIRHHKDPEFAKEARERVLNLFPVLRTREKQRAGLLSGGEQQMLALAQSLLCRPRVLLIDELSLGLAPSVVSDLLEVVRSMSESGVTIVIVEQSINVATAISSRAIFMERGRVRFSGPTPDLSEQPELLRSVFLHAADRARKRKGLDGSTGSALPGASAPGSDAVLDALFGETASVPNPSAPPAAPVGFAPGVPAIAAEPHHGAGAPEESAFSVVGVSKSFGGVAALTDVTLHVGPGEILGIIGSNGAGKTTLFDVCSGFSKPDSGFVTMNGVNITESSPGQRSILGLARVFQDARLWPSMSVKEALATALERFVPVRDPIAAALNLAEVERSEEAVENRVQELIFEFGLERFEETEVSALSTGTRRIVELACAVAHEPQVLLLDEPTAGIAQRESEALAELLLGLREQTGASFIVIEHDVPLVSSLADRMVCMHLGEVIAEGETTDVLTNPAVVAAYLGTDVDVIKRSGALSSAGGGTTSSGSTMEV